MADSSLTSYGAPTQAPPNRPQPTLATAMASADEMEKRLGGMLNRVMGFAQAIGGLFPVGNAQGKEQPVSSGAIAHLNERMEKSHRLLSAIEDQLGAVGRTLGL